MARGLIARVEEDVDDGVVGPHVRSSDGVMGGGRREGARGEPNAAA